MILTSIITFEEHGLMDLGDYLASNFKESSFSSASESNGLCQVVLTIADLEDEREEEVDSFLEAMKELAEYLDEQDYFIHLMTFSAKPKEDKPQPVKPSLKIVH